MMEKKPTSSVAISGNTVLIKTGQMKGRMKGEAAPPGAGRY